MWKSVRSVVALSTAFFVVGCDTRTASPPPSATNRPQTVLEDFLEHWRRDGEAAATSEFVDIVRGADVNALKLYPISEDDFAALPERDRTEIRRRVMRVGDKLIDFAKSASQVAAAAREENRDEEAGRIADSLLRVARANFDEPTTLLATRYATAVERYGELARGTQNLDADAGGDSTVP